MWPFLRGRRDGVEDDNDVRVRACVRERVREGNVYLHSLPTGAWEEAWEEAWSLHERSEQPQGSFTWGRNAAVMQYTADAPSVFAARANIPIVRVPSAPPERMRRFSSSKRRESWRANECAFQFWRSFPALCYSTRSALIRANPWNGSLTWPMAGTRAHRNWDHVQAKSHKSSVHHRSIKSFLISLGCAASAAWVFLWAPGRVKLLFSVNNNLFGFIACLK